MTDLGTLGTDESYAWAINNRGQITGYSDTPKGETHAFWGTWSSRGRGGNGNR